MLQLFGVLGFRERGVPYGSVLFVFGLAVRRRHYRLRSVFVSRGSLLVGLAVKSVVLVVSGGALPPGSVLCTSESLTGRLRPVCVLHVSLAGLGRGLVGGCW